MNTRRGLVIGVAALFALTSPALTATAAERIDPLQEQIERVLADYPGGEQISPNQVSWDDGEAILTIPLPNARAVGSCATGRFCAYSGTSLSGLQMSFSSCSGTNSPGAAAPVRSVANGRTSGSVFGYNGNSVTVTVGAGDWTNTTATITRLGC